MGGEKKKKKKRKLSTFSTTMKHKQKFSITSKRFVSLTATSSCSWEIQYRQKIEMENV